MESLKNSNHTKCITPRFSLPLFMVSRNRIKYTRLDELRKYIKKMNHGYDKDSAEDLKNSTLQCQQVAGTRECKIQQNSRVQTKGSSQLLKNSWKLPPNLYDTGKIPYENKKGIGGAHWQKCHTHQARLRPDFRQQHASIYIFRGTSENIFTPCNRSKGAFLTNPRERRATTRCMVNNAGTCYRNPSDPGPATYNPTLKKTIFSANSEVPNPHLFHRSSIVPVKRNSVHIPHTSFTGAPGRYETRYPNTCPCSAKLLYQPTIDLLIDKEKRKKFRRLSFKRMNARNYTSPDWRHVKGRGYRNLFVGAKPPKHKPLTDKEVKGQKNIQLYPDSKYIGMINNPVRTPLSLRSSPVLNSMPRIKFNCTAKKVTRKHLRNNKKIAFNSSQERFRDSFRMPLLTQKRQEELKQALPLERQLRDHPIMNKPMSEINSKLNQTPKHMLPNYVPKLRKKIFKFQPLPQPKVLATESDTSVWEFGKNGYYLTLLEAKQFFKDGATF